MRDCATLDSCNPITSTEKLQFSGGVCISAVCGFSPYEYGRCREKDASRPLHDSQLKFQVSAREGEGGTGLNSFDDTSISENGISHSDVVSDMAAQVSRIL